MSPALGVRVIPTLSPPVPLPSFNPSCCRNRLPVPLAFGDWMLPSKCPTPPAVVSSAMMVTSNSTLSLT